MSRIKVTNLRHESATSDNITLDSSGNVSAPGNLSVTGTTTLTDDLNVDSGNLFVDASTNRIGVGTTSPDYRLDVNGEVGITEGQPVTWHDGAGSLSAQIFATSADDLRFRNTSVGNERMRIISDGTVFVAKTAYGLGTAGHELQSDGKAYHTSSVERVLIVNKLGADGILVGFYHATAEEGNISVSGSTVSYNGGHLSRWSQLAGNAERIEILRGSVLSNIDEMCVWAYDAEPEVLWAEGDELPEGVSVGDVKTPAKSAGTELNEQLNRMKVSDVEGDPNVAGVFQCWDDADDTYTNDFYCAMTGDFVIRIAEGVTVQRGDLLMSAGDGTAKPQDDDIIRSKTIAKVTSTNVSCTYDDGSYCVPCVLMAC